jgi:acyl carrier protein
MRILVEADVAYAATRVRAIIAEHFSVKLSDISDSSSFTEDLGADSLASVDLLLAFETEFNCEISNEAADTIQTVGDAIRFLLECNRHPTFEFSLANCARSHWRRSRH